MGRSILAAARRWPLLCAATLLLAACGKAVETPGCDYKSENLLDDPIFETLDAPKSKRRWQFSEHAAGKSFEYGVSDGVLTIEQQGIEPWGMLKQTVNSKPLRGRLLEFKAELKLDLDQPAQPHGFTLGGGLSIMAKSNNRLQLSSAMDHEPHMGKHDWFTARVVTAMPRQMNFLQVGFLHQAGGVMQVRNPSLRVVAEGCPATVIATP